MTNDKTANSLFISILIKNSGGKITNHPPYAAVPDFADIVSDSAYLPKKTIFMRYGTLTLEYFDYLCAVKTTII
jgi:hypothetical protein